MTRIRYFSIARRPGVTHKWYKHPDYGNGCEWDVILVGPRRGGAFVDGEYEYVTQLREAGWELIITELPHWEV